MELSARKILNHILIIARNITARKQAEDLLGEKEIEIIKLKFNSLTKTERKIFHSLRTSKCSREIAREFDVTISTVDNHIHNINKKLGFNSRLELSLFSRKYSSRLAAVDM